MISTPFMFIYLHVPKTGGNSIQTSLLPFSDDRQTRTVHQDGRDRFGVRGPITPRKHAMLSDYQAALPEGVAAHKIIISVRHPYTRAVSNYFSPHRWVGAGGKRKAVQWSEEEFIEELSSPAMDAATDYLRIDGEVTPPDIFLKFEALQQDFQAAVEILGLPTTIQLPHVNRSVAEDGLRTKILGSRKLRDTVEECFKDDMDFFNYQPYKPEC